MKKIHFLTWMLLLLLGLGIAASIRPALQMNFQRWQPGFSGIASALALDIKSSIKPTPSQALHSLPAKSPTLSTMSSDRILRETWNYYKTHFMADGSHVVSNNYGGTITEGQSYALLKAVWMDDPETFGKTWQWTQTHMRRPHDHLLGWRWSNGENGAPKGLVETENATDADQDIAYALLVAGKKWKQPRYTQDGLSMVRDLWRLNVQALDGKYYLTPGTWEGFREGYLTLDPSYFAPYVYRAFAAADVQHAAGWTQLADDIYDTLEACSNLTQNHLPPNWCAVKWQDDHQGSRIVFSDLQGAGSRDFGYDAFRVYWRMGMDAKLSPSPGRERALTYLKKHAYPLQYWQKNHYVPEGFTADGHLRSPEHAGKQSGFSAGPVLVISHALHPEQDAAMYQAVLAPYYHPEGYWFNDYNDFLHSVIWLHLYAVSLK
jgi:endo-1,4-beta-D-glucanase Y